MIHYLSVEQVLELHRLQVRTFGGAGGLRDRGALESAVMRPQMTFDGEDLYPDLETKAAVVWHSLLMNHPFVDGNKRAGAMAAEYFLAVNGVELLASDEELVHLTLTVGKEELGAEAVAIWLRQRGRPRE